MPTRVFVPDARGNDQYLRATWHPETAVIVVSHWVGQVCVASTPVGLADASKLIGVLVTALQDAATTSPRSGAVAATDEAYRAGSILGRLRRHWRPKMAQIIALHRHPPMRPARRAEHDR